MTKERYEELKTLEDKQGHMRPMEHFYWFMDNVPENEREEYIKISSKETKKELKKMREDYIANGGKFITEEDIESGKASGGWLD